MFVRLCGFVFWSMGKTKSFFFLVENKGFIQLFKKGEGHGVARKHQPENEILR